MCLLLRAACCMLLRHKPSRLLGLAASPAGREALTIRRAEAASPNPRFAERLGSAMPILARNAAAANRPRPRSCATCHAILHRHDWGRRATMR